MEKIIHNRNQGDFTIQIDDEDEELFNAFNWITLANGKSLYVGRLEIVDGKQVQILFSRCIMKCPLDKIVKYKNGDTFDLRKKNLVVWTHFSDGKEHPLPLTDYKITEEDMKYARNQALYKYNQSTNPNILLSDLEQIAVESLFVSLQYYNKIAPGTIAFRHYAFLGIKRALNKFLDAEYEVLTNNDTDEKLSYSGMLANEDLGFDYSLLSQSELDLWEEFKTSKMNMLEFSKYKGIKRYSLRKQLKDIRDKIEQGTYQSRHTAKEKTKKRFLL